MGWGAQGWVGQWFWLVKPLGKPWENLGKTFFSWNSRECFERSAVDHLINAECLDRKICLISANKDASNEKQFLELDLRMCRAKSNFYWYGVKSQVPGLGKWGYFPLPGRWDARLLPNSRDLEGEVKSQFPGLGRRGRIPSPGNWEVGSIPSPGTWEVESNSKPREIGSIVIYITFNFPKFGIWPTSQFPGLERWNWFSSPGNWEVRFKAKSRELGSRVEFQVPGLGI